jgi:hypothetical protein
MQPIRVFVATAAAGVLLGAAAPAAAQVLHATLEGFQEVPALSTAASGSFRARLDRRASAIHWELTYADIASPVLQSHIHFGQHGVNGGISAFLCTNLGNGPAGTLPCPQGGGTLSGTLVAADVVGPGAQGIAAGEFDELVEALRRGVAYVNVHSQAFPGGEVRGQVK